MIERIYNVNIIDVNADKIINTGIEIENGVITKISPDIKDGFDAKNNYLIPGIIDLRTYIDTDHNDYQDEIQELINLCKNYGIVTSLIHPSEKIALDNSFEIQSFKNIFEKHQNIKIEIACSITKNNNNAMAEIGTMLEKGALCLSNGNFAIKDTNLLLKIFKYNKIFNKRIFLVAQDPYINQGGQINEGELSVNLGLQGIPKISEIIETQRIISLASETNTKIHLSLVSTKESLEIIRQAKNNGVDVTCDVSAHHFTLNENAIGDYKTHTKLYPPLRCEEDRIALINGLKDGTIDAVVSDHRPKASSVKRKTFPQSDFGAIGIQTLLPLCLNLYHQKYISLAHAIKIITANPAKIIGQHNNDIAVGMPATFSIVDINKKINYSKQNIIGKYLNTPYETLEFLGDVLQTYINGKKQK